ncbi:hypothetical protein Q3G72_000969 [Acer saccharum]|nr:hypothetical protein Q3G72_000969 [Acer saccharum]
MHQIFQRAVFTGILLSFVMIEEENLPNPQAESALFECISAYKEQGRLIDLQYRAFNLSHFLMNLRNSCYILS